MMKFKESRKVMVQGICIVMVSRNAQSNGSRVAQNNDVKVAQIN